MCCGQFLATRSLDGISKADVAEHITLAPAPASAARARRFVRDHAGETENDDTLLLLTSELVTNGVLHARTSLVLGIVSGPETILVTVADDNEESPVQPPPDDERPSGRGLMLVGGLADDWGVQSRDSGKTVWFTVARARRGARASVGDG